MDKNKKINDLEKFSNLISFAKHTPMLVKSRARKHIYKMGNIEKSVMKYPHLYFCISFRCNLISHCWNLKKHKWNLEINEGGVLQLPYGCIWKDIKRKVEGKPDYEIEIVKCIKSLSTEQINLMVLAFNYYLTNFNNSTQMREIRDMVRDSKKVELHMIRKY